MIKQEVSFYSEGALIKGHLYLPNEDSQNLSGIVLAHGFAGVKELLLPAYAEKFAEAGLAALTFDYRGFGESEGIEGHIVPNRQITDIRNAITFLTNHPQIDPDKIGLWGTSFGGANSIVATSIDKRIKCLSVQLTFGNGERVITGQMNEEEKAKLFSTLDKLQAKAVGSNRFMMLPLIKVLTDEQSIEFYNRYVEEFPALNTKVPFNTLKETIEHKPELALAQINVPLLVLGADNDGVNPIEESQLIYNQANEPKQLHIVKNATHYQVYEGEMLNEASGVQIEWFKKYLN